MTTEPAIADPKVSSPPSTAGMTAKVVKGSAWTLAGQVLPVAVSLLTAPFVIRFLGSERYGVLVLVGLIPSYFAFADLGMGFASTKFASEAYSEGDSKREAETVWTAASIAVMSSSLVAVPILLFSGLIVSALNVPDHLHSTASIALKISTITYLLAVLSSVLNTPQLSRLRMDLNTAVNIIPKIVFMIAIPVLLYFGSGIIAAVTALLCAAAATTLGHILVSGRLQPMLFRVRWNPALAGPLFKFAGGWLFAAIAAVLLMNTEKLMLTRLVSVQTLAHYSVAFTFASVAALFSGSMLQSLLPAFSQLLVPEKKDQYEHLFTRTMRLNIAWVLPALMILIIMARPFFTLWAGEEFGRESTGPFYILIVGLFFNMLAFIPNSTILAAGRTSALAKLYWIELALYIPLMLGLIYFFGILGAAAAWSARVTFDMFLIMFLARRNQAVTFAFLSRVPVLLIGVASLAIPVAIAMMYDNFSLLLIPVAIISLGIYSTVAWGKFLEPAERDRVLGFIRNLRYRFAS